MEVKIKSALISVYNKEGLEDIVALLATNSVNIYSTGGTQKFIESLGAKCIAVETLTGHPSIFGGRVKTLHPTIFGAILSRNDVDSDVQEMEQYHIPQIDLVIVDLYPFEETVKSTNDEKLIIEKIDVGGPSMIRAAAKNFQRVLVVADKKDYSSLKNILSRECSSTLDERKDFARKAFDVCTSYDFAISEYFNQSVYQNPFALEKRTLRYGENPHQVGEFSGDLSEIFEQLNGKELSYNNMVDVDAALELMKDCMPLLSANETVFAIIKHTNVCGSSIRANCFESFKDALAGDPESAFGGVLISSANIDIKTAELLKDLFFEVLIAPDFDKEALELLRLKKNRILLKLMKFPESKMQVKSLLGGFLTQQKDEGNFSEWKEEGGRDTTEQEKSDLAFANIICKHLKSNAISIVKNRQLLGKGCGQTSRIDALRQAIDKAKQFDFDLQNSVVASDAFFPFDDCVKLAHEAGVTAFIEPGGSIRDKDSISYCKENKLALVMTGSRHFKH